MYKQILLPTDGSELSERAAQDGVRLAKSIGAQLTALHVTPLFYPSELHARTAPQDAVEHEKLSKESASSAGRDRAHRA